MFDKNWFYYTKNISENTYNIDIWLSTNLVVVNNEYIIFHKRHFKKLSANELQKNMQILTQSKKIDNFQLDEKFFKYSLIYYQRQKNKAYLKNMWIEEKEIYENLFESFGLKLRFIEYLEILWNYEDIETIQENFKTANLNQALSFLLWLASVYWEWNLVEEKDDVYLWNILVKFPFDWSLWEYQDIIINLEDILIKNQFYNNITFTKNQDFIINIKDKDLLEIFWEAISKWKLADFFQTQEPIRPFFNKNLKILSKQLDQDLRIKLDDFKLTEIKGISLEF